jgi:hypothetical protein
MSRKLGRGAPHESLVEDPVAGGTDLPLHLVGDPRALPQSVLDDGLVPVTPVLTLHLHVTVLTSTEGTS